MFPASSSLVSLLMGIGIIVGSVVIGVMWIASGDLMEAIREIALNTRKEEGKESYKGLEIAGTIVGSFGWLVVIGGSIVGILFIVIPLITRR